MRFPNGGGRPGSLAWPGVVLLVSVLALCGPLLTHGALPQGSDVYATVHYLQGFMKAFSEGDLYPRWTDASNQGLGGPSFVMFPPLTYYGSGAASWLTGSIISGMKLYLVAIAVATFLSFHALARQWIGPGIPAALAAAVYLLLPYHVLDVYQRFALSETTAFVFFPLILLFARRCLLTGRPADFLGVSLAYAGLLYTHIVSSLMFTLLLAPWLLLEARGRWRALTRPVLALACGLALAAPALLPAVTEKAHANIDWVRQMPNGNYRINFIFKDPILPGLGIKDPVKPPVLKSAHTQLLLAALASGLALSWTAREQARRRRDILVLAGICAATYLMQTDVSIPVWEIVPELATIQFPWRFQTIMVLTASLLTGYALSAGWGRAGGRPAAARSRIGTAPIVLAGVIGLNLALSFQNAHLKPFGFTEEVSRDTGVTYWIEPAFTPVQFTRYREFKTLDVRMPQASFLEGTGEARVTRWLSSRRRLEVSTVSGGVVALRSFWFPGWAGRMDGAPLELSPAPQVGVITFRAPPGTHDVEVTFEPTPPRRAASWIALAAALLAPALAWWSPRPAGATGPAPSPARRTAG